MFRYGLLILITLLLYECAQNSKPNLNEDLNDDKNISDEDYIVNFDFTRGDVRRYGIFPNQPISQDRINKVLDLAQKGLEIEFPQGVYNTNLNILGLQGISLFFEDAIITGGLQIIDLDTKESNNISIKGCLTVLDKVFIRKSQNIEFDTLFVKSDTLQNIYHKMNRGVSIYAGSKNIKFKKLQIFDTGGSHDDFYKYSASALQVHGWNNNPEFITIDNLIIENAQRTAVYLTGNNHLLKKAVITNYAQKGEADGMFGLEDALPGTEKEFTGFWLSKCNNCEIDSLVVSNNSTRPYSLKFGIGTYSEPAVINYLSLKDKAKQAPIEDDLLTNVLVKHEY